MAWTSLPDMAIYYTLKTFFQQVEHYHIIPCLKESPFLYITTSCMGFKDPSWHQPHFLTNLPMPIKRLWDINYLTQKLSYPHPLDRFPNINK